MIAANYRKFPEAMALQLVLVFGRCKWHTARPTQRLVRAVRAARAIMVKETPQLVRWVKKATPEWFKQAKRAARELANQVKAAIGVFVWDLVQAEEEREPLFKTIWAMTEQPQRKEKLKTAKPTRCNLKWCEEQNWDGIKCRAAFCGLKGPKGGYH